MGKPPSRDTNAPLWACVATMLGMEAKPKRVISSVFLATTAVCASMSLPALMPPRFASMEVSCPAIKATGSWAARKVAPCAVRDGGSMLATTDARLLQPTRLREQTRQPAPADEGADASGRPGPARDPQLLKDVAGAAAELKQFRDSVLARPLPRLGYRQYPRLREEVQTVAGMIARPMMPPTAGEVLRAQELGAEVVQAQARPDTILPDRAGALNRALQHAPHGVTPAPPPARIR